MEYILSKLKKYKVSVILVMITKMLCVWGELLIPFVLEHMIDDVVPTKDMKMIIFWGVVMIVLAIVVRQVNVFVNRKAVRTSADCAYEIREELFARTMSLSGSQTDEIGLPSLISRMTSDSYNVQNFIRSIQLMGVRAPFMLIGGIVVTLTMDAGLASILCIAAPIMLFLTVFISLKGIPLYENVQESLDDVVSVMRENITGIRVVKALSKENYEKGRYGKVNDRLTKEDIKAGIIMALPTPIIQLVLNVGLTLVVYFGAVRVNSGATKSGVILAFLTYFNMILMGVMGLSRVFLQMSKADASAKRIAKVTAQPDILAPIPMEEAKIPQKDGYIVFDHVEFSYNKLDNDEESDEVAGTRQKCLYDIDFAIPKGGSLGIIGATGCGKTTILNLLMRFYDADEGAVFIGGRDVRTFDKDELHRMFGVVFQNDVILTGKIKDNIVFGRSCDDDGVKAAATDARAADFIEEYEDGYEHVSDKLGANFSGGQKQRILIARALAAKPDILLLDDSSSALDYKTDAMLRKAIRENHADTTTIVVAQRISSLMSLDKIIVLDEGHMIGYGTHEELMNSCRQYREVYETQMGDER